MEEVSLGQLVGTAVKFTIAFSLVESFNAVVMRGYSHLFIDKCKTCRGSGVVKCRHCKGYGSVRVWPATVDEAAKSGNYFKKPLAYATQCPSCMPVPGNSDFPNSYTDSVWQNRKLARSIEIGLVLARRGEENRKKVGKVTTGCIRCPECEGSPTIMRSTPNWNRFLNRDRRRPYWWIPKHQRPLKPGNSYFGSKGRSNVNTDTYGHWLDNKLSEYNAPIGSNGWEDKGDAMQVHRLNLSQKAIDARLNQKIKDGALRYENVSYFTSPGLWEKAKQMGRARPTAGNFDLHKWLQWKKDLSRERDVPDYVDVQREVNDMVYEEKLRLKGKKSMTQKLSQKQGKSGLISGKAVGADDDDDDDMELTAVAADDEVISGNLSTGFSIGKKGADNMQM
ncbi:hypothetical protein RI054_12g59950 [Pseudoscourfieldia marina]